MCSICQGKLQNVLPAGMQLLSQATACYLVLNSTERIQSSLGNENSKQLETLFALLDRSSLTSCCVVPPHGVSSTDTAGALRRCGNVVPPLLQLISLSWARVGSGGLLGSNITSMVCALRRRQ
jgi:hypothetical protein